MKRSTKQLLSLLLAIVMVCGLMAPAMAARPMGGDVAETPATETATRPRSSSVKKATLMETTGEAKTYKLDFTDTELSSVAKDAFYAAGKYGTDDFFTFSDNNIARKEVGTGDAAVPGLNVAKNGGNYIGFAITGTDATVKVTFRGGSSSGKVSGGAVVPYTGGTAGTALVDANNDTSNIASNQVTVTATYTNVATGDYRIVETANQTSVHVLSVEVTETNGNVYVDCQHTSTEQKNAVAATCTAPGKEADTVCSNCGKILTKGAAIEALGHKYENGVCTRCGDEEVTVMTGGSWKANLDSVPGATGTATDNTQYEVTADTQVKTEGITAVELWVPADKYKYKGETGAEGFDGWLAGNTNGAFTEADGVVTYTGAKFVFKAKADGILTIYTKVNSSTAENQKPYFCLNKEGKHATANSGKWFAESQVPLKDAVQVKNGDEITVGFKGGKIMLYGFDFTVSINESWKANLDSVPGATGTATDNTQYEVTADTQVKTEGVTAVELWVPADKYKYKGETGAEGFDGWLAGNTNGAFTEADGVVTYTGAKFVFKAKADGILTIYTKVNSSTAENQKPYFCLNKEGKHATANSGKWFAESQVPLKDAVQVKNGDEITVGFKGGKIMLYGFDFKSGSMEEVTAEWTAAAQGAEGATITGTPDNTKGTITVTVTGPKVGVITDEAAGTMTTYADSLTVQMLNAAGDVVATKSDVTASDTHSIVFNPPLSGTYTFKASLQREGETDIPAGEGSVSGFILPLEKPAISSAASNGAGTDGKVGITVMWGAVTEADTYKVFVKETSAAAWPTDPATTVTAVDGKATYSYVVPGLTAETSYDFKVSATRTSTSETLESEPATAVAEAEKVTAWTEVTFGTSATDMSNWVVGGPNAKPLTNYQDPGKTATVNTTADGSYTAEFKNYKGETVKHEITGLTGDLNTDPQGRVLLSSRDGAGKIKENEGADGLLFYYTPIPAGTNYTLKADVEVLRWNTSNTQNGVGLAAMDRVPAESWTGSASNNAGNYWDNVYFAGAARTAFSYDRKNSVIYSNKDLGYDSASNTKYSYYMGLMSIAKYGIPVLDDGTAYTGASGPANYYERRFPLDTRIPADGVTAKAEGNTNRFNTIGNYSGKPAGFSLMHENSDFMSKYELTKFTLTIQKNNTGYISTLSVKDANGKETVLGQNIDYFVKGAMDLSGDEPYHADDVSGRKDLPGIQKCLDKDYEYVGFFTAREMDALFTNVQLTTIPEEEDADPVSPPITYIAPSMSISSGDSSNSEDFIFSVSSNVEGTVTVTQNGSVLPETYQTKFNDLGLVDRVDIPVKLKNGNNTFTATFQPDPNQKLPAVFTELANTETITKDCIVKYQQKFGDLKNLYVSPTGRSTNYGTKARPLDVYTAVSVVRPGQNIILLDGVYNLTKTIRINRGMNGTEDQPIYFVAEPGAHVVLNGQRKAGSVLVHGSDWWIFKDFEVVGASGVGFQVSGNHNIVQNIKIHDNLTTGLQISTLSSSTDRPPVRPTEDKIDGDLEITDWGDWPCYNTILNCESYRNYDSGYDGADGFGAKERCGTGNVFDGCAAYWNADDGWDFYAKTAPDQGPLGRTTIINCVAFQNGYEVRKLADVKNVIPEFEDDGYNAKMNLDADGKIVLTEAGNGNGFKMGGSHLPGAHRVENSFAFYNKAKGIDSNNGPDIKVVGCTSYNNAQENVGLKSDFAVLNYLVEKTVSFKDDNAPDYVDQKEGVIKKMKDSAPEADSKKGQTSTSVYNYYQWDGTQTKGVGTVTGNITADNFVSLDFDNTQWVNGAVRDADGTLALGDFLRLTGVTDAGAGELVNNTTPVENPDAVVNPPEEGPSGGNGGAVSGGNGGSISEITNKKDEDDKPADSFTAKSTTDAEGNTEIVVTDANGETVADVKIPATIPAPESKFEDVADDHWAADAINNMAGLSIVNGIGDSIFGTDNELTRAQLATMLYRFANGKAGISNTFADVPADQWYTDAIGWAVKVGVVTGYSEDAFGPNDVITREQLAVMLSRFAKLVGLDTETTVSGLVDFSDRGTVSEWAKDGMSWCVKNGIINGVSADTLSPATSATRAQTALMLDRFIGLMK